MLTTSIVIEKIIRNSPFLSENISQGLINYSALARIIKPKVEKELQKKVTTAALLMSLKRLSIKIRKKLSLNKFISNPDMIVRSNLTEFTFLNSESLAEKHKLLLQSINTQNKYFLTVTQGVFETTIITGNELKDKIKKKFEGEKIISQIDNLSSITIKFSKDVVLIPGIFYFILKPLVWENINIIEVVSTLNEFTILLDNRESEKAFFVIKSLFSVNI